MNLDTFKGDFVALWIPFGTVREQNLRFFSLALALAQSKAVRTSLREVKPARAKCKVATQLLQHPLHRPQRYLDR